MSPEFFTATEEAVNHDGAVRRVAVVVPASTVQPEVMTWIDPGRLGVGALTMGVGLPDQGKTLIACDAAARLSTGSPLAPARRRPGVERPRPVLILTNEDTLGTTIVPRLIKAGADLEHINFLQMVRNADGAMSLLTLADDIDALELAITDTQPALVIIDGLVGYLGADVKSHNDADVRRVLTPFAAMLARTGTAGLGLMHPPKAVTNLAYYAGGSIAFTAVPRVVLGIAPDPEDESPNPRRFLAKLKGNLYGRVPTLAFTIAAENDSAIPWVEWEPEPVTVNIADLFDPVKESPEDRSSRRRCEEWLRSYLSDGPQALEGRAESRQLGRLLPPHAAPRSRGFVRHGQGRPPRRPAGVGLAPATGEGSVSASKMARCPQPPTAATFSIFAKVAEGGSHLRQGGTPCHLRLTTDNKREKERRECRRWHLCGAFARARGLTA